MTRWVNDIVPTGSSASTADLVRAVDWSKKCVRRGRRYARQVAALCFFSSTFLAGTLMVPQAAIAQTQPSKSTAPSAPTTGSTTSGTAPGVNASGATASGSSSLDRPIDDTLSGLFNANGSLAAGGFGSMGGMASRQSAPPPPAPSPSQLKGFGKLQQESDSYHRDAKEYRDAITSVIRHHYELQRRRTLSSVDSQLSSERTALEQARTDAIQKLEAFIDKYAGSKADPEATPDAMFRLAALYDERTRARTDTDVHTDDLKPAIALYKRIINGFPQYREIAAVYYYLGHALYDSERLEEAQQVWRALVCSNHYPYPVAKSYTFGINVGF